MADIDKLEAIARAAPVGDGWFVLSRASGQDVRARHVTGASTWIAECRTKEDAAHIAAFSPERVLALLAVVRAASKVSAMSEDGGDSLVGEAFSLWFAQWQSAWATLRTALAALDALEEN